MTDSGGTLINAAKALLDKGAKEVAAYVTHGVLSNGASANIDKSMLKELVITDTINPSEQVAKSKKIRTLTLAPLIGEAIRRIANDESISKMFD
jgi:ribose-phosphate pyrophosphokinase